MRRKWPWIVGALVAVGLIGNAVESEPTTTTSEASECDQAFTEAAAVDEMEDANEDLFPAVRACASLEEWSAASAQYPDALDGADPETVLANLCLYQPEISSEPLCP